MYSGIDDMCTRLQFELWSRTYCVHADWFFGKPIRLNPASIVWLPVRPLSFSSRLIRVTAAPKPMKTAKMGSATLEMI